MNTAANAASAVSSVVFGYLVAYSGGYDAPFLPMLVLLCVGIVLWVKVDPTENSSKNSCQAAARSQYWRQIAHYDAA